MKTTVIYHKADYDGIFCREIAKKFLPDAKLVGWDHGETPLVIPDGEIYVLDLPLDSVFGFKYKPEDVDRNPPQHPAGLVWIDHHQSSIATHPRRIPGYRIDGVAACRLAWQWFTNRSPDGMGGFELPSLDAFKERRVSEPLAVRLAGEYDIWDKRDPDAELFQFGLDAYPMVDWDELLQDAGHTADVHRILNAGRAARSCIEKREADIIRDRSFEFTFEGLSFLCLNTARCNSNTFKSGIKPHHAGLIGFWWNGSYWNVSLYGVPHRAEIDLSKIAVKYGGGGHRQACGFRAKTIPWIS